MSDNERKRLKRVLNGLRFSRGELQKISNAAESRGENVERVEEVQRHLKGAIVAMFCWLLEAEDEHK